MTHEDALGIVRAAARARAEMMSDDEKGAADEIWQALELLDCLEDWE